MSASAEAAEHLDRLVVAGDHEHVGVEHAAVHAGALEQAAGQREHPRPPGGRLVPRRLRRLGRVGAARRQQPVGLLQRQHLVDHRLQQRVARLGLLGHAGPDEHAAHVLAVELLDRQRRGDHRGDDGHEPVDQLGVVLAHVLGDGRAGGRDVHAGRVLVEVVGVGPADQVGALRDLHHVVEPGRLEGADQLPGGRAEARREGRRQEGGHGGVLLEQPGRPLQPAQVRLGVLGADQRAVAAGDAALVDHERLAVLDADRLRGAVPHAGVAPAAVLLDRRDDGPAHGLLLRPPPRPLGLRSVYVRCSSRWLTSPSGRPSSSS